MSDKYTTKQNTKGRQRKGGEGTRGRKEKGRENRWEKDTKGLKFLE